MPTVPVYLVDAFTSERFAGNPAAVCLLDAQADPDWMQSVAAEMNLSETAFVRPLADGYELRWFTPAIEVELCGHATLAAAHVLWNELTGPVEDVIRFHTHSGVLSAARNGELIELDFPATPPAEVTPPPGLIEALGVDPLFVGETKFDKFVVVDTEQSLLSLEPDFRRLKQIAMRGVMVTSESSDPRFDFLSRFFAPGAGVDEDPVTGSAHCCLGPYWAERFGRRRLTAYQASRRGGVIHLGVDEERVSLGGQAVTVLRGELV